MKELEIVEAVEEFLNKKSTHVVRELPFLQRRVDIVAYEPATDLLIATEAKVKNWRSALLQAISCLLFANEVYIAMPEEYIHRVKHSAIAEFGIGLLQVNSTVEIIVETEISQYATQYYRRWVINQVEHLKNNRQRGQDAIPE